MLENCLFKPSLSCVFLKKGYKSSCPVNLAESKMKVKFDMHRFICSFQDSKFCYGILLWDEVF